MRVAIHQPNFFPWLGYFDKIMKSDVFVFLDDVAYPKSGSSLSSWVNRVKILIHGEPSWINCPIIREHGVQMIKDVKINENNYWREKLSKTIEFNYKKSPYYHEIIGNIQSMVENSNSFLSEYNINNIKKMCKLLGIEKEFVIQSSLGTSKSSTDLLIEIVKKVGADTYICGGGASRYQEDEKFFQAGLKLEYQNYDHPLYNQRHNDFIPGLSIIDALFNCGIHGVFYLLKNQKEGVY